jgi:DNA-directed RNA polymerase alpha subunit
VANKKQESPFPPGVAQPAVRALNAAGYTRLEQLTRATETDLMRLHGMGPKALRVLRETLAGRGLSFAPEKTGRASGARKSKPKSSR